VQVYNTFGGGWYLSYICKKLQMLEVNAVQIIGFENYLISIDGKIFNKERSFTELKPTKDNKGYLRVSLSKKSKKTTFKVHRLVAKHFISNPHNKPQVNHKNGIKTDNNVENLEWATAHENNKHAYNTGLNSKPPVVKKLNEQQVLEIRAKFKKKIVTREMLGKEYNVTANCIKDVILRKSWKHI
jgi:hypothetical protein